MKVKRTVFRVVALLGAAATVLGLAGLSVSASAANHRPPRPSSMPRYNPAGELKWFTRQRLSRRHHSKKAYAQAEQRAIAKALAEERRRVSGNGNPVWQPIGPAPLDGPPGNAGRVTSIAPVGSGVSEQLFFTSAGGGVWSGTLNGTSSVWSTHTDFASSLAEGSVAVAPSNHSIVYSGTGEDNHSGDSFYGNGLLASNNGGANWTTRNPGGVLSSQDTSRVAVDPSNPSHIYLATSAGFFSSTNGGVSLTAATTGGTGDVTGMVVDPTNFNTIYISVPGTGIEKSVDGGANFVTLVVGTLVASNFNNTTLAIDPTGQIVYAEITTNPGVQVWKTTNAGTTWSNTSAPDVVGQPWYYGGGSGDQGFYDVGIAVDPSNSNVVYLAGIGLAVSINGGTSWSSTACGGAAHSLGCGALHPDFHSLVFDSSGNLFIGNDGGLYELPAANAVNGDSGDDTTGANFVNLNTNEQTLQFDPGVSMVGNAATVMAGEQDNGTSQTTGSTVWSSVNDGAGDGAFTAIDPLNTAFQWTTAMGRGVGVFAGTNDAWAGGPDDNGSGVTAPAVMGNNFVPPFILGSPSATFNQNVLYFGGETVYKSADGGQTWTHGGTGLYTPANPASCEDSYCVSALAAAAPPNTSTVYAGWGDGTVQRSVDSGATWTTITPTAFETPGSDQWITHIAVDPANSMHVVLTFSGFTFPQDTNTVNQPHVLESTNGGTTWTNDTGTGLPGAPVNTAVFDSHHGTVIVGTDAGVYSATLNGGTTSWTPLGASLAFAQVEDLALSSDGTTLVAVTHGRGAWKLTLPDTDHPLIFSAVRFQGPSDGGTPGSDEFFDLYNTSPSTVSLNNWKLVWSTGSDTLTAGSIPPGGHYLIAGPNYSLATNTPDLSLTTPQVVPPGGVQIMSPTSVVSDAVGYTTAGSTFREGTGLTAPAATNLQYAYGRLESNGEPVNTQNNASDFQLVSPPNAGGQPTLTGSASGEPLPPNGSFPLQQNYAVQSALLDPTETATGSNNQVYNSGTHTLTVYRTLTNNGPVTITTLDLLASQLSVSGGPASYGTAQLVPQSSIGPTTVNSVTVQGLTLNDGANLPNGGGLFSSWSVPLPGGGLTKGSSVSVAFQFHVAQTGHFSFAYDALASP